MKSSVKVDLNWDNKAVIKIHKFRSDDVRDKLVNQVVHFTPFFKVSKSFDPGIGEGELVDNSIVNIEPVSSFDLPELILDIERWIAAHPLSQR